MIEVIRQHLEDTATTLTAVEIAEDLDALVAGTAAKSGTAFVVPFRERAKPNSRSMGGHLQLVQVQFVVAFVIQQHSDAKGAARARAFDSFKTDIEQALAGWQPEEAEEPFELVGGESSSLGNNRSVYAQTWETSRFLTGDQP